MTGPCRITMHHPNKNANRLFTEVQTELYKDSSFFEKYWMLLIFVVVGVVIAGIVGFTGESPRGAFIAFLIFLILGGIMQCIARMDTSLFSKDKNGINRARTLIEEKINMRIRDAVHSYHSSLARLERTNNSQGEGALIEVGDMLPYSDMNAAGCLPVDAIATYEVAWNALVDRERIAANTSPLQQREGDSFFKAHERWLELFKKAAGIAANLTRATDRQRVQANKIAMKSAIGNVTDLGLGATGVLNSTMELGKQAHDLKGSIDDIRTLYKDAPSGMKSSNFTSKPRTGIHAILVPVLLGQLALSLVFCVPAIVAFHKNDMPGPAWVFGILLAVLPIFCWFMAKGKNQCFNALEDLAEAEAYLRSCIEYETRICESRSATNKDLVAVTNILRNEIVESYYDTSAIHCQTGLFTFGSAPTTLFSGTPYFWASGDMEENDIPVATVVSPSTGEDGNNNNPKPAVPLATSVQDESEVLSPKKFTGYNLSSAILPFPSKETDSKSQQNASDLENQEDSTHCADKNEAETFNTNATADCEASLAVGETMTGWVNSLVEVASSYSQSLTQDSKPETEEGKKVYPNGNGKLT